MTALAYVVSHGRIVLEGTPDWSKRVAGVVSRLTPSTCRRCGGEDFIHLPVNGALCINWKRSLGAQSTTWMLHQKVADIVGRRTENIEALMQQLTEALKPKEETALQRDMRLAMSKPGASFAPKFVPSADALKGLRVRRADGRPFADENGRTTLTATEAKNWTKGDAS